MPSPAVMGAGCPSPAPPHHHQRPPLSPWPLPDSAPYGSELVGALLHPHFRLQCRRPHPASDVAPTSIPDSGHLSSARSLHSFTTSTATPAPRTGRIPRSTLSRARSEERDPGSDPSVRRGASLRCHLVGGSILPHVSPPPTSPRSSLPRSAPFHSLSPHPLHMCVLPSSVSPSGAVLLGSLLQQYHRMAPKRP
jgi:hypothetical protein